eukprot:3636020-Rhodomonas_salina.1
MQKAKSSYKVSRVCGFFDLNSHCTRMPGAEIAYPPKRVVLDSDVALPTVLKIIGCWYCPCALYGMRGTEMGMVLPARAAEGEAERVHARVSQVTCDTDRNSVLETDFPVQFCAWNAGSCICAMCGTERGDVAG